MHSLSCHRPLSATGLGRTARLPRRLVFEALLRLPCRGAAACSPLEAALGGCACFGLERDDLGGGSPTAKSAAPLWADACAGSPPTATAQASSRLPGSDPPNRARTGRAQSRRGVSM